MNLTEKIEGTCDNGMTLTLSDSDFHTADAAFVYDHMNDAKTILSNTMSDLSPENMVEKFKLIIITTLFLVCFKAPENTIKAFKGLIELFRVPEKELKEIIHEVLEDREILTSLNRCVREVLNVKK